MERLLQDLNGDDLALQAETFATILQVFRDFAAGPEQAEGAVDGPFPNDLLLQMCSHILLATSDDCIQPVNILYAKAMQKYLDFKYYSLRNFARIVEQSKSEGVAGRIFDIMSQVSFPSEKELSGQATLVPSSAHNPVYRKGAQFKTVYSACWMAVAGSLPSSKSRKFLMLLGKLILPHLTQPQLMTEFLSRAHNAGGLNGVLALDGLFVLMRDYNLDFPSFYDRLYELLNADLLNSVHRNKLLKYLNIFMSSTMVPAYVVAGIVKRISRLCLGAPPSTLLWAVPFIYNLLWHHPTCRVLIHRGADAGWIDPYLPNEPSLSKCAAIDSSLWEINALETHYWPKIAKLAQIFREKFTKPPFDVEEIIDELDDDLIITDAAGELEHRWSKRPPVQSAISHTLFD